MYSEILVEVGSKDSRNSTEKNSQRTADIRGMLFLVFVISVWNPGLSVVNKIAVWWTSCRIAAVAVDFLSPNLFLSHSINNFN